MPKKIPKSGNPETHEKLKGFDIRINEFGQIESTLNVEKLNEFLDEEVVDKKIFEPKKRTESKEEEE